MRAAAAELSRRGENVRHLRSTIIPGEESLLCLFEAGCEELVRTVYSRAGIPFERISAAIAIEDSGAAAMDGNQQKGGKE